MQSAGVTIFLSAGKLFHPTPIPSPMNGEGHTDSLSRFGRGMTERSEVRVRAFRPFPSLLSQERMGTRTFLRNTNLSNQD